jgi:hypothetical protein
LSGKRTKSALDFRGTVRAVNWRDTLLQRPQSDLILLVSKRWLVSSAQAAAPCRESPDQKLCRRRAWPANMSNGSTVIAGSGRGGTPAGLVASCAPTSPPPT